MGQARDADGDRGHAEPADGQRQANVEDRQRKDRGNRPLQIMDRQQQRTDTDREQIAAADGRNPCKTETADRHRQRTDRQQTDRRGQT